MACWKTFRQAVAKQAELAGDAEASGAVFDPMKQTPPNAHSIPSKYPWLAPMVASNADAQRWLQIVPESDPLMAMALAVVDRDFVSKFNEGVLNWEWFGDPDKDYYHEPGVWKVWKATAITSMQNWQLGAVKQTLWAENVGKHSLVELFVTSP